MSQCPLRPWPWSHSYSELGLATHFIHSSRVPQLLERLSALERPTFGQVASAIDDLYTEREPSDPPFPFAGGIRDALDDAFSQATVEDILAKLRHYAEGKNKKSSADVVQWARDTVAMLEDRSPTSLKVALQAIRRAKKMNLEHALAMELNIAKKFCVRTSPRALRFCPLILTTERYEPRFQDRCHSGHDHEVEGKTGMVTCFT